MHTIGSKLQQIRQSQNLTLRALAAKADVSASLLSQIENGKATPSVMSLLSIAAALSVPAHEFFPDGTEEEVVSDAPVHASNGREEQGVGAPATGSDQPERIAVTHQPPHPDPAWNGLPIEGYPPHSRAPGPIVHLATRPRIELMGGVTWERLTPGPEAGIEFLEITYVAGGSSGPAMSRHNGREFGVVLEGELCLELGFERYFLRPGDSVAFDSEIPHRLSNPGTTKMRAIWINLERAFRDHP